MSSSLPVGPKVDTPASDAKPVAAVQTPGTQKPTYRGFILGRLWYVASWVVSIPFLPFIGIYYAIAWFVRGGARFVWDDFGSFIVGSWAKDPKTGETLWMRGVWYPEIVHFHPMVWVAWTFADS